MSSIDKAIARIEKTLASVRYDGAPKEWQSKAGGLTEKGRKAYNRQTGGNLQRPVKDPDHPRHKAFCARMKGQKKKMTGTATARDPESRINKSLRRWNCH
jgi:hypothetical protein